MATPQTSIRGDSLEELIKAAKKLPTKPVGTICNMFRTSKPSKGGDGYTPTRQIAKDLYVQCFGECKKSGEKCTLGWININDAAWHFGCNCFPP